MKLRVSSPRLLPATIVVIAALLVMKSVTLVRAGSSDEGGRASGGTARLVVPAALAATPDAGTSHAPGGAPAQPRNAKSVVAPEAATAEPKQTTATSPAPDAVSAAPVGDSERALLLDLRQRRKELDSREAALVTRESVLSATEKRLSARVDELQGLQSRLQALEAARHDRDEANWRGLVKLYENMKPRDAAAIFNDLDMPVLLQVVDRMKEAKAAPVLAAMQAEKARQLTAMLADMRTRANTPGRS